MHGGNAMRRPIVLFMFPFVLLSTPVAAVPVATPEDVEVALLTVRHDNLRTRTTADLLPLARYADRHFHPIASELDENQTTCPVTGFRGWQQPGVKYTVFLGGLPIGEAIAQRPEVGSYDCSALCVVSATTNVKPTLRGRKDSQRGFNLNEDFDESLTQFVALSASSSRKEFRTVLTDSLSKAVRRSVIRLVTTRLKKHASASNDRGKVEVEDLRLFHANRTGGTHAFVRATLEGATRDEFTAISALVAMSEGTATKILWELVSQGDQDKGAEVVELVDALDLDGDGRSELIGIYHNYEFHEFQFFQLVGGRYEVVHKGPSYGC